MKLTGILRYSKNYPSTTVIGIDKAMDASSGRIHSLGMDSVENLDNHPPMVIMVKEKPAKEKDGSMDTDGDASGAEANATKKMAERVADMKKQKGAMVSIDVPPVEEMDIAKSDDSDKDNGLEDSSFDK